jgi:hypothetical protein
MSDPDVLYTSPCECCSDEGCPSEGCARYRAAAAIAVAAEGLAQTICELALTADERCRAAHAVADTIAEALSVCAARLCREKLLAACGLAEVSL